MICTDCPQRDVCDLAGKDDPLLTGCDASHGTWAFDRLRLDRMTADRDAIRAELERTKEELERVRGLLMVALPHVEASAGAQHLMDGFRPRKRPLDDAVEEIRAALERKDGAIHGS